MNTGTRLGLYGGGLAVLFAASFGVAAAVVPDDAADSWERPGHEEGGHEGDAEGGHGDEHGDTAVRGLAIEQDGYRLGPIAAPAATGTAGELAFQITGADGEPVTEYTTSHEKDLHLIVVRSDGSHFRHAHPELAADGTWSLPWTWDAAGTYRVYTDFVPADGTADLTLTRTVEVAGDFGPQPPAGPVRTAEVDGYTVTLEGDLTAGASAEVTASVSANGEPVTELEPYLGAFGHLVALREGDLAYLHVHPEGEEPQAGDRSGPAVAFATTVPTEGRYYLYFDFQVAGEVHSAAFVVDTAAPETEAPSDGASPGDHESGTAEDHGTEAPAEDHPSEDHPTEDHSSEDHGH